MVIGDTYVDLAKDEAEARLESDVEACEGEIASITSQMESYQAQMGAYCGWPHGGDSTQWRYRVPADASVALLPCAGELKTLLYAKFGKSINLEEE